MVSTASRAETYADRTRLDPPKATVSVDEAADILGIGRNTAYDAVRRGEIPSVRIGRRIVIPRAALERLLMVGTPHRDDEAA